MTSINGYQETVDRRFGYDNSVFLGGVMQIQKKNDSKPLPDQHVDFVRQLIDGTYDITEAREYLVVCVIIFEFSLAFKVFCNVSDALEGGTWKSVHERRSRTHG